MICTIYYIFITSLSLFFTAFLQWDKHNHNDKNRPSPNNKLVLKTIPKWQFLPGLPHSNMASWTIPNDFSSYKHPLSSGISQIPKGQIQIPFESHQNFLLMLPIQSALTPEGTQPPPSGISKAGCSSLGAAALGAVAVAARFKRCTSSMRCCTLRRFSWDRPSTCGKSIGIIWL